MAEEYNGISWEEAYPDKELRHSIKIYSDFFRDEERKLRKEERKQQALARNSLDNLVI